MCRKGPAFLRWSLVPSTREHCIAMPLSCTAIVILLHFNCTAIAVLQLHFNCTAIAVLDYDRPPLRHSRSIVQEQLGPITNVSSKPHIKSHKSPATQPGTFIRKHTATERPNSSLRGCAFPIIGMVSRRKLCSLEPRGDGRILAASNAPPLAQQPT